MITLTSTDSINAKLGRNVRAPYRRVGTQIEGGTCPSSCPLLKSKACYAMYGHVSIAAKRSDGDVSDAEKLKEWLTALPKDKTVRHHVSGDVMGSDGEVDEEYVQAMLDGHAARPDIRGWVYTHAWRQLDPDRMNQHSNLAVNASCEDEESLAAALMAGWPATLVVAEDAEDQVLEIDGNRVRVRICPAQTNSGMTCSACMMCAKSDRAQVIGFRVHGNGRKKLRNTP